MNYFTHFLFEQPVPISIIVYEPINPFDSFGKVMVSNLAARGIVLQTLRRYGSFEAQEARMRAYGFSDSYGMNVKDLWEKEISEGEKSRIAGLEMLDEVEEWELLAAHYCTIWAWRGGDNDQSLWADWPRS